jgi:hypothetical protein
MRPEAGSENKKLLCLIALVALLGGMSPAQAATYTYAVDYDIGPDPVTGSIVLNCNSCDLSAGSIVSWSLTALGLTISGTNIFTSGVGALTVSPSQITFTPIGFDVAFVEAGQGCAGFNTLDCGPVVNQGAISWVNFNTGIGTASSTTADVVIATATPLPAALPLFATGIGAMGLFGWRRKRKNTAVQAA